MSGDAYARLRTAIASIRTPDGHGGSGWVAIANGVIATGAHVVGYAKEVTVALDDPPTVTTARVIHVDLARDFALLLPLFPMQRGCLEPSATGLALGQGVFAVGHPPGGGFTFLRGTVASAGGADEAPLVDVALSEGMSGGPLVDERGLVVAIALRPREGELPRGLPVQAFEAALAEHAGDPWALGAKEPSYECPSCKEALAREDDQCPGCGAVAPFRVAPLQIGAPERGRGERRVFGLLGRLGHDPTATRVAPGSWRVGEVAVTLAADGAWVTFETTVAPMPAARRESLYRFLLTFADEAAQHAIVALEARHPGEPRVVARFSAPTSWLDEKEIAPRLQALLETADRLKSALSRGFDA